ncbi:MAG: flavodoxin family protein [Clostridiales Family XIII bacterium]|jgi:multimeric flavodoxin WrbA|nr:flavodoxin family protein [Clostridiales Family XIII bacterium]
MRVIGINGSPRREWNTAQMVEHALRGAADAGAETKLYHLRDFSFKGCVSCFACLLLGAPTHGRCSYNDALKPVLDDILAADALILGSPVYFGDVTAGMRALLERLWFGGLAYDPAHFTRYERRIPVKVILTTNAPAEGFHTSLNKGIVATMSRFFGPTEIIEANDTLQFDDYARYDAAMFDVEAKKRGRAERFPKDLERAYETGKRAAAEATEQAS